MSISNAFINKGLLSTEYLFYQQTSFEIILNYKQIDNSINFKPDEFAKNI